MERQPRDLRRDGALVLIGLAGLVALQVLVPTDSVTGVAEIFRGGLFGGSVSVMAAGVFRVPDEQAVRLTAAVAAGFALGSLSFLL
ncbi:hypothetical protein C5B86_08220 [Haloferax sp. Atlit-19N]|uniref:hypothetical protein n=1 Tax=Haloferax sp. Atlit-19N TaxID=2077201 RepID=UPI000E22020C|nr:hypothetical protein [Haloferax sp. Atlit-19N]RDZ45720.1 hypothetical protein C5B86_08220 [Haloferax sp. Atlit-19N]